MRPSAQKETATPPASRIDELSKFAIDAATSSMKRKFNVRKDSVFEIVKGLEVKIDPMELFFEMSNRDFGILDAVEQCGLTSSSEYSGAPFRVGKWMSRFTPKFISRYSRANAIDRANILNRVTQIAEGRINPENHLVTSNLPYTSFYALRLSAGEQILWCKTIIGLGHNQKSYSRFSQPHWNSLSFVECLIFCDLVRGVKHMATTVKSVSRMICARGTTMPDRVVRHPSLPQCFGIPDWLRYSLGGKDIIYPQYFVFPADDTRAKEQTLNLRHRLPRRYFSTVVMEEVMTMESRMFHASRFEDVTPNSDIVLSDEELAVLHAWGSIILLGRSGTGKTTTAILRIWRMWSGMSKAFGEEEEERSNVGGPVPAQIEAPALLPDESPAESAPGFPSDSALADAWARDDFEMVSSIASTDSYAFADDLSQYTEAGDQEEDESDWFVFGKKKEGTVQRAEESQVEESAEEIVGEENVEVDGDAVEGVLGAEEIRWNAVCLTVSPPLCVQVKKNFEKLCLEKRDGDMERDGEGDEELWVEDGEDVGESDGEEEMEEEVEELLDSLPPTMRHLDRKYFPMFCVLSKFLRMIDGTLDIPFFERTANGEICGEGTRQGWHQEGQGVVNIAARRRNVAERPDAAVSQMVDYDFFASSLWPHLASTESPSLVWTEIAGFIKGSAESLNTEKGFLSLDEYTKIGRSKCPTFCGNRESVYMIFERYEKLKRERQLYDQADLVFHIYSRLQHEQYKGTPIHSFFIDEAQDFSLATLKLLFSLCLQPNGFFVSGDTAQTIARGAAFRFADVRSLFFQRAKPLLMREVHRVPPIMQLSHNYRAHDELLLLGHSIVRLMEHIFPESIDKLPCSLSDKHGILPQILPVGSDDAVLQLLVGPGQKDTTDFGAAQVVLVRNQQAKLDLPPFLRHALTLTIFEAKGLEFTDVILYNFFGDSTFDGWQWLWSSRDIPLFSSGEMRPGGVGRRLTENELVEQLSILFGFEGEAEEISAMLAPNHASFSKSKNAQLIHELKHLYAACTRSRQRLFILEKGGPKSLSAVPILAHWLSQGLAEIADPNVLQAQEAIMRPSSAAEWRQQGVTLMRQGFYEASLFCLERSGDARLAARARAHMMASDASKSLQAAQALGSSAADRAEKKRLVAEAKSIFRTASEEFVASGHPFYAARCLFSAEYFEEAARLFLESRKFKDAGVSYQKVKLHRESAAAFELAGPDSLEDCVDEFEKAGLWEDALRVIATSPPEVGSSARVRRLISRLAKRFVVSSNPSALELDEILARISPILTVMGEDRRVVSVRDVSVGTLARLTEAGLHKLCTVVAHHLSHIDKNSRPFLSVFRRNCIAFLMSADYTHSRPDIQDLISSLTDLGQVPINYVLSLVAKSDHLFAADEFARRGHPTQSLQVLQSLGWPLEWKTQLPVISSLVISDSNFAELVANSLIVEAKRLLFCSSEIFLPSKSQVRQLIADALEISSDDSTKASAKLLVSVVNGESPSPGTDDLHLIWDWERKRGSPDSDNSDPALLSALAKFSIAVSKSGSAFRRTADLLFGCCPDLPGPISDSEPSVLIVPWSRIAPKISDVSSVKGNQRVKMRKHVVLSEKAAWFLSRLSEVGNTQLRNAEDVAQIQRVVETIYHVWLAFEHDAFRPSIQFNILAMLFLNAANEITFSAFNNLHPLTPTCRAAVLAFAFELLRAPPTLFTPIHFNDRFILSAVTFHVCGEPYLMHEYFSGTPQKSVHSQLIDSLAYCETNSLGESIAALIEYNSIRWNSDEPIPLDCLISLLYSLSVRALSLVVSRPIRVPNSIHLSTYSNTSVDRPLAQNLCDAASQAVETMLSALETIRKEREGYAVDSNNSVTEYALMLTRIVTIIRLAHSIALCSWSDEFAGWFSDIVTAELELTKHDRLLAEDSEYWLTAANRDCPIFEQTCEELNDSFVEVSRIVPPCGADTVLTLESVGVANDTAYRAYVLHRVVRVVAGKRISNFCAHRFQSSRKALTAHREMMQRARKAVQESFKRGAIGAVVREEAWVQLHLAAELKNGWMVREVEAMLQEAGEEHARREAAKDKAAQPVVTEESRERKKEKARKKQMLLELKAEKLRARLR